MSVLVNRLPVAEYASGISSEIFFDFNRRVKTTENHDEAFIYQVDEQREPFEVICGDVSSTAPIIIFYGQGRSTLRTALMEYVKDVDITLICFSIDIYLWQWVASHPTKTVASLVVQPGFDFRNVIDCSHKYSNVYSVLVRCESDQVLTLQRFVRSYARVDGIFDSDQRLLVKLFIDLTLFSEELGDEQREDEKNEFEAQRHYDRALKFCALVKKV